MALGTKDHLGRRGEYIAFQLLTSVCEGDDPYFLVHFLGDKSPLFDAQWEHHGHMEAAITLMAARSFDRIWLATVVFLIFAVLAWIVYATVLKSIDHMALGHREELIAELTRAS